MYRKNELSNFFQQEASISLIYNDNLIEVSEIASVWCKKDGIIFNFTSNFSN